MAVAAPQMAVMMRAGVTTLVTLLVFGNTVHAQPCRPALPVLQSDKGNVFTGEAYGLANWQATVNGRRRPYAVHVWTGKADGKPAYLTFDEIPGTSGPNYHLDTKLKRPPARIDWTAKRDFAFDPRVIIRSGPLAGVWTVTNCPAS